MPKTSYLKDAKRICVNIEGDLHARAQAKAASLRLPGGFSEYVARLLNRDMQRRGSAALGVSRHLRQPALFLPASIRVSSMRASGKAAGKSSEPMAAAR